MFALQAIESNTKPTKIALDVYILLAGISSKVEDASLKVKMEENEVKMLNITWKEYDIPGEYKW